ncbi:hypothetical protein WMF39_17190 [Sorangium sp. So ce1504]
MTQVIPEAHIACIEPMKLGGWDVEEEPVLRAWLMHRSDSQDDPGPIAQN